MALYKVGSRGTGVKTLQSNLAKLGFKEVGKADSIFGKNTQKAVRNFQSKYGLKADSLAGKNTLAKINQLLASQNKPKAPAPAKIVPKAPASIKPVAPKPPVLSSAPIPEFKPLGTSSANINIESLLDRANKLLSPGTQLQKDAATSSFNSQMQQLNNQFASRGLLASGVAATQQQQAVQGLAGQMAQIEADQQGKALDQALQQGQFLEGQRQFDLGFALDEANVTGKYLPAGARDIINDIVQQKRIAESANTSTKQKQDANNRANFLRQQLQTMGVNPSAISSGTNLSNSLQNLQGGLGNQTQQAMEFAKRQNLAERQFGLESELGRAGQKLDERRFGLEAELGRAGQALDEKRFGLDQSRFAFEQEAGRWEMAFKGKQQEIDRNLAQQGINIDRAQLDISRMNAQTDAEYKQHLMDMEVSTEQARRRTQATIADVINMGTADEVYSYLMENATSINRDGVDVRAVLDAVERKFPNEGFESAMSGGSLGELE